MCGRFCTDRRVKLCNLTQKRSIHFTKVLFPCTSSVNAYSPKQISLKFFQPSLRNCTDCVHCDDHFFIFISFPQFVYDLFHISLTIIIIIIKHEKLNIAEMASESQYQTFYQLKGEMRDHHNLSRLNVTSLVDAYFLLQEIGK